MKVLLLMDALETIHIEKDTSFSLAYKGQEKGYDVYWAMSQHLIVRNSVPFVQARHLKFKKETPCWEWMSETTELAVDDFDAVMIRKDPPFDEDYFMTTHFLSLCKKAKVINRPSALREAPEKLYPLLFPQICPPSIITRDGSEIRDFMLANGGKIIVKPLNRCGGAGIIMLTPEDTNFNSLIELSTDDGKEHVIAQKYLPEIKQGDKRVILVMGQALDGLLRTPQDGETRSNLHVGGTGSLSPLTERDQWLVDQIKDKLVADGLYFVGIDIIGDYITEINVTSPTGIQEILALGGNDIAEHFWDKLKDYKG
ncbi:MAG: glutathione synthase [SAR324 cluster bacterium]|nr:glutathione synthase [SAR324 cluster bacterium]